MKDAVDSKHFIFTRLALSNSNITPRSCIHPRGISIIYLYKVGMKGMVLATGSGVKKRTNDDKCEGLHPLLPPDPYAIKHMLYASARKATPQNGLHCAMAVHWRYCIAPCVCQEYVNCVVYKTHSHPSISITALLFCASLPPTDNHTAHSSSNKAFVPIPPPPFCRPWQCAARCHSLPRSCCVSDYFNHFAHRSLLSPQ